jgi:hypothetical protein
MYIKINRDYNILGDYGCVVNIKNRVVKVVSIDDRIKVYEFYSPFEIKVRYGIGMEYTITENEIIEATDF